MTRRNEELLYGNLEALKTYAVKKYDLTDDDYIADIDLVLIELLEFGCYKDFDVERYEVFNADELAEFIDFYAERTHVNCIVSMDECIEIIEMLFDIEL